MIVSNGESGGGGTLIGREWVRETVNRQQHNIHRNKTVFGAEGENDTQAKHAVIIEPIPGERKAVWPALRGSEDSDGDNRAGAQGFRVGE